MFSGESFDNAVVVCGGGAAGMSAAISAAREGANVLLVEAGRALGGTVANTLLHTLAGFYDSSGELLNRGIGAELLNRLSAEHSEARRRQMGRVWVFEVDPHHYRQCAARMISAEPRVQLFLESRVTAIERSGSSISRVRIEGPNSSFSIEPAGVIDATGGANMARLVDPALVIDDPSGAATGKVLRLHGVEPRALAFPRGAGLVRTIRQAVARGELPALFAHAWLDTGTRADEVFVKLMLPREARSPAANEENLQWQRAEAALSELLRKQPGFASCEVVERSQLGFRDAGRLHGRYVLRGSDVREGRRFADGICRAAWPIEFWDSERGATVEYLPAGTSYDVPLRSLQAPGIDNFWVAGKCLSADREAQASARVAGTCWAMGEAAGCKAAACVARAEGSAA